MASCQILWKTLWKSMGNTGKKVARKSVEKRIFDIFKRRSWWKNCSNCGLLNKIHIVAVVVVEKCHQIRLSITSTKSTIST